MLEYLPTILVAAAVVAVITFVIVRMVINKRRGKRSCSCGGACSACPFDCGAQENK